MHEAQCHEAKCFVTLTYNNEHLPDDYSVSPRHMQLWHKRLRKKIGSFRFFLCGEYGDQGLRPHYHVALFGYSFPDRKLWGKSDTGYPVYRSAILETAWPFGNSEIGELTQESAGYVARYMLKKINGDRAPEHYRRIHPLTGEVCQVTPEFIRMSNRPGIGAAWYEKYAGDAFPSDFVVINGQKRPVPRYYAKKLEEKEKQKLVWERKKKAANHTDNNTPERLAVREESLALKVNKLKRTLE